MSAVKKGRVFFDANEVDCAQDSTEPSKRDKVQNMIRDALADVTGVISGQVYGEVTVRNSFL